MDKSFGPDFGLDFGPDFGQDFGLDFGPDFGPNVLPLLISNFIKVFDASLLCEFIRTFHYVFAPLCTINYDCTIISNSKFLIF